MSGAAKSAAVQKASDAAKKAQEAFEQKKKQQQQTTAGAVSAKLHDNPMYFANLPPNTVRVTVDRNDKKKFNVEFATAGGTRAPGNHMKNTSNPFLCEMLVSAASKACGEGNVGLKHKGGEFHRSDATYSMTFRVGTTASGLGGEELLEKQRQALVWVYEVSRAILGCMYDLNPEDWKGPIQSAKREAMLYLWRDILDGDGNKLTSDIELEQFIETKTEAAKKAAKRVDEQAREIFINLAVKKGNMPCAPIYDEVKKTQIIGRQDLWTHGRVYQWRNYSKDHPARMMTGPLLSQLPSNMANWPETCDQMTAIDRTYSYAYELFSGEQEYPYRMVETLVNAIDERTGAKIKVKKMIRDPFHDPLLETKYGVKVDTLVRPQITFAVKRGLTDVDYGVKVRYGRKIQMVAQEKRPLDVPEYNPDYQTGFVLDDEPPADYTAAGATSASTQATTASTQATTASTQVTGVQATTASTQASAMQTEEDAKQETQGDGDAEDGQVVDYPATQPMDDGEGTDGEAQYEGENGQDDAVLNDSVVDDDDDDDEALRAAEEARIAAEEAARLEKEAAAARAAKAKQSLKRKTPDAAGATPATPAGAKTSNAGGGGDDKRIRK